MFLKNYSGNVEDLCLTFAIEQYGADQVPPEHRRQVGLGLSYAYLHATNYTAVARPHTLHSHSLNSHAFSAHSIGSHLRWSSSQAAPTSP